MPAINALLPIVSASNSQKEGTQNRAQEARVDSVKIAESAVAKGVEQDAAAEKRMQQKRFINVYEEGIQEQGRQQERRAQTLAAIELAQRDDAAALAVSGSVLPPVGEPLPTLGVPASPEPSVNEDPNEPIQAQVPSAPSAPIAQQPTNTEQPVVPVPTATETLSPGQQQAADDFHALVVAQNGKADAKQQAKVATQQGIVSAATAQASESALVGDIAQSDAAAQASTQALENTQKLETSQQDVASKLDQSDEALETTLQTTASFTTLSVSDEAAQATNEPEQAQLVRAWRGLEGQERRSADSVTTQATSQANQANRQDPLVASVPVSLSGQIQQFAQSLRLSGGKADATVGTTAGDRSAASSPQSSAELSAWRADSATANAASTSGRVAVANTPFAQAMQASNFGQPLGEAVGQNAWGESIAQRVSLMAGLKVSSAQIQLDPPELGAMTVKVSVNGDQASVSFHSPHALVRDALELSFPRLQEMMGQQGLQLVDAQVSDNSSAGQGSAGSSNGGTGQARGESQDDGASSSSSHIVQVATGLIDFYA